MNPIHWKTTNRENLKLPSNRRFALLFVMVFAVLAIWRYGASDDWLWLVFSTGFALVGLFAPRMLTPLNHAWMRFGLMLSRIVSPLVLGFMYVVLIVPVGFIMKLIGRDVMQRKPDPRLASYWQGRENTDTEPESFRNQY